MNPMHPPIGENTNKGYNSTWEVWNFYRL